MDDIDKNIEEYNPNKKKEKYWLCLMISDQSINKNLNPLVTELFMRGKKIKHLSCFYYTMLFRSL